MGGLQRLLDPRLILSLARSRRFLCRAMIRSSTQILQERTITKRMMTAITSPLALVDKEGFW